MCRLVHSFSVLCVKLLDDWTGYKSKTIGANDSLVGSEVFQSGVTFIATWSSEGSPPFPLLRRPLNLRMLSRMLSRMLLAIELVRLRRLPRLSLNESPRPAVWSDRGSHRRTTIHGRPSLPVTYSPFFFLRKQKHSSSPTITITTNSNTPPTAPPMMAPIGSGTGLGGCVVGDWEVGDCVCVCASRKESHIQSTVLYHSDKRWFWR